MRFALQDDNRIEAMPKANGCCPSCGAELVAKCGTKKIWHWAHKGRRHCDHWWENETQWHRDWKNCFPTDWQEVAARDEYGELHIADIKTPNGLVVEFQHSYLKPDEIMARTMFHRSIVWVVDGTRVKRDIEEFKAILRTPFAFDMNGSFVHAVWPDQIRLLKEWWYLRVCVAFDFGWNSVWLMPICDSGMVYGYLYPKSKLIDNVISGNVPLGLEIKFERKRRRRSSNPSLW